MSAANKHIQPGYTTITPYLYAKLDLVDFLKNAFGAEVTHTPTPDAEGKFHAEAKIGDAHLLFGNGFFQILRWRRRSIFTFPMSMRLTNAR